MYTIKDIADESGVTTRTLRYYDMIGLLTPTCFTEAGYRLYTDQQVDQLQQIILLKQLGLTLSQVKDVLDAPPDKKLTLLESHYQLLEDKEQVLQQQKQMLKQTIQHHKGEITMTTQQQFDNIKKQQIIDNEAAYGEDIRKAYGEKQINESNEAWLQLTEADMARYSDFETTMVDALLTRYHTKHTQMGDLAFTAFSAHKEWLQLSYPAYTPQYHQAMVELYTSDDRFAAYYEAMMPISCLTDLKNIVLFYTQEQS